MNNPSSSPSLAIASALVIILAMGIALSGCGQRTTPVELANEQQVLLLGNGADPEELDPHLVSGITEARILNALLEGLIRLNDETLQPEPAAASDWTVDDSGRVYTFHLRPEARWSDGQPVTAQDFSFAFRRILSPALGAPYASMLHVLKGADAYNTGQTTDFADVGVRVIDSHTLELELDNPSPYFLSLLSHFSWFPVPRHTVLDHGAIHQRGSRWTKPGNFVGNGPFLLTQWNLGESVDVARNPRYWQAQRVRLSGIRFLVFDNLNAEERAFRAGQIHVTQTVPLGRIAHYKALDPSPLHIAPYLGTYYFGLNVNRPGLNDPRVRQALSLAIDRTAITQQLLQGVQTPALHFTPPNINGYTTGFRLEENPDKARQLLAAAGYPNGRDFPRLEILYNTSESHRAIAELIQERWRSVLNIEVGLMNQSWGSYLSSRRQGDFDIIRAGWIGDYYDASTFLGLFAASSGNNHTGWTLAEYDELLTAAAQTADAEQRHDIFDRAETLLLQHLPVIPIYFYNTAYLIHPAVRNWPGNLLDYQTYLDLYLDDNGSSH